MKYNRLTRRMFLQGSGKTLMAMPFLTSLLPREAWGQAATVPKRYVSFISNEYEIGHNAAWLPNTNDSVINLVQPNRTLNPAGQPAVRWQPLSEFVPNSATPLARLYGTSLNNHLSHLNIIRGLDLAARFGHGAGQTLGAIMNADGANGSLANLATMDSVLAANRIVNPNGRLVYAGAPGIFEGFSRSIGGGQSARIEYFDQLYNILFNNGTLPEGGGSAITTPHPRRDLLTRVVEDYNRLINSRNISSLDKIALTNAMDKMSDVNRGLQGTTVIPVACSHRNLPRPGGDHIQAAANSEVSSKILVDMITASILCDSNRIFTIGQLTPYYYNGGGVPADILNYGGDWHQDISHLPFTVRNGAPCWQWTANCQSYIIRRLFAPLVQALGSAIDPSNGQSYLYNSIIHASFNSGLTHGYVSHPAILAGNAGGSITSGNYIDYSDRSKPTYRNQWGEGNGADNFSHDPNSPQFGCNWPGVSYNRLLVTIMQAMGLQASDYENDFVNRQVYNRTDIGSQNANLTSIGGFNYAFGTDRDRAFDATQSTDGFRTGLSFYDLRQFRNRLPMP